MTESSDVDRSLLRFMVIQLMQVVSELGEMVCNLEPLLEKYFILCTHQGTFMSRARSRTAALNVGSTTFAEALRGSPGANPAR